MATALKYVSKLQGKRVLVLGGTSGMGFCVAEAALEHGAHVVVSGSNEARLSAALSRLRQSPVASFKGESAAGTTDNDAADSDPLVSGTTCDLSDNATMEANIDKLLRFATADGQRKLDHVVLTAGDPIKIVPVSEATPEEIMRVMTVRYTGAIILAKLLPKYQYQSHTSSLTITSGANASKPSPNWSLVAGVSAAVQGLGRGLAVDLKPVRVNVVSPGAVHTELFDSIPNKEGFLAVMAKATLTGHVGRPEDAAEAYLYCMKDNFITGTVLDTNGGKFLA